jgi:hypothetical protein
MKDLIILFNRIESHINFNPIDENEKPAKYLFESTKNNEGVRIYNGFGEEKNSDHFHRLLPNQSIIGNTFGTNTESFKSIKTKHSEVLLIQLSNNILKWKEDFREDFKAYTAQFDRVFISYHLGANKGDDIRNGNHTEIAKLIPHQNENIITTDKYHHEYLMGGTKTAQLYGSLATAVSENKGQFSNETYSELIKKMLSFFSFKESEQNREIDLIRDILTNMGSGNQSKESYNYCLKKIPNFKSIVDTEEGRKLTRKILDKRLNKL